jgi:hypothetical protein
MISLVMSKRQRRQREKRRRTSRRVLFDMDERLGHAPQFVTASVVSFGLAGAPVTASLCADDPCAKPPGTDAVMLPHNLDIDTIPTRINYVPVIDVPFTSGGTIFRR